MDGADGEFLARRLRKGFLAADVLVAAREGAEPERPFLTRRPWDSRELQRLEHDDGVAGHAVALSRDARGVAGGGDVLR